MTQPDPGEQVRPRLPDDVDDGPSRVGVLEVDGEVIVGPAVLQQVSECGEVPGELRTGQIAYPSGSLTGPHRPVVADHRDPVDAEPHVGLEACGAEPQGEQKSLQGVFGGVGPPPTVGEADRMVEEGGKSLLHQST